MLVPSHLVGRVLLSASNSSWASLLAALFLRAAASWRRATAALARDRRGAVDTGAIGGLAVEKVVGQLPGGAERSINEWTAEMGITW